MDKHELLTLAASQIAGGMAGAVYGQAGNNINQGVIEYIAKISLTIALKISQEAIQHAKTGP